MINEKIFYPNPEENENQSEKKETGNEIDELVEDAQSVEEKAKNMIREAWEKVAEEFQNQIEKYKECPDNISIELLEKGVKIFERCLEFDSDKVDLDKAKTAMNLSMELSSRQGVITKESWQIMLKIARETKEFLGAESYRDALEIAERGYDASEQSRKWNEWDASRLPKIKEVVNESFRQPMMGMDVEDFRKARDFAMKMGTGEASDKHDWEWALEATKKTAEVCGRPEDYRVVIDFVKDLIEKEKEQIKTGGFNDKNKRLKEYKDGREKELEIIIEAYREKERMAEKEAETKQ